jgi:hypothetical protein
LDEVAPCSVSYPPQGTIAVVVRSTVEINDEEIHESDCIRAGTRRSRSAEYGYAIGAIFKLGANKFHPLPKVQQTFKEVAGAEWYDAWANKEKRTADGLDADAKFLLNLKVLQRTKDYGRKLLDAGRKILKSKGAVIDLQRDSDGELIVRLNLDSATPMKAGRKAEPKVEKPAKADQKPKPRSKGPKGKKKVRKAQR